MPTASAESVEEARVERAMAALPGVALRYAPLIESIDLQTTEDGSARNGAALWHHAVADVQQGQVDDRSLYWARLAFRRQLLSAGVSTDQLEPFERASRGFDEVAFASETNGRRVLITGFDPFQLDREIGQSNPSGLAALSLDGRTLATTPGPVQIEAVVFPVRFEDFGAGLLERFLEPLLRTHPPDLILTLSMGRDAFDLERFPGRHRSATAPDNRNLYSGASAVDPIIPRLGEMPLEGPEFIEFSLPAKQMLVVQSPWPVRDNHQVTSLQRGVFEPASLAELAMETAVQGSGGGYLSNEISYRSVLLVQRLGAGLPVGHLHTPSLVGYDPVLEQRMVDQIIELLIEAVVSPGADGE